MIADHHPHRPRALAVEQPHRHIARMLLEREVETERRVQRFVEHALAKAAVERLHLRARRDFGEEVLADLRGLVQRR